jgi:hypothetical protein
MFSKENKQYRLIYNLLNIEEQKKLKKRLKKIGVGQSELERTNL